MVRQVAEITDVAFALKQVGSQPPVVNLPLGGVVRLYVEVELLRADQQVKGRIPVERFAQVDLFFLQLIRMVGLHGGYFFKQLLAVTGHPDALVLIISEKAISGIREISERNLSFFLFLGLECSEGTLQYFILDIVYDAFVRFGVHHYPLRVEREL